jgi:molybdopterin-guanine dinucleotide biosynthesis protein A
MDSTQTSGASGIILAGGGSRRMGRDKLPMTVGGVSIIRRVYDVLREACDEVIVVGAEEAYGLPEGTRGVRDLRSHDGFSGAGPLAGLESGLHHARYEATLVAAGDMPFLSLDLTCELLRRLCEGNAYAVAPRVGGLMEPLCAAYSRHALGAVGGALDEGVRAMRDLLGLLPEVEEVSEEEVREFGDPGLLLMNVNSPEHLARARGVAEDEHDG